MIPPRGCHCILTVPFALDFATVCMSRGEGERERERERSKKRDLAQNQHS